MADKKTFYLIDYENVHEDGLEGSSKLTKNDYVNIFTSKNAPYFSVKALAGFNNTHLYFHEVPASKQSVDMNLATFFGYLVAQNDTGNSQYIIVSKDTDYDNVITFWRNKRFINVIRQEKIKPDIQPEYVTVDYNGETYKFEPFGAWNLLSTEELVDMLKKAGIKPIKLTPSPSPVTNKATSVPQESGDLQKALAKGGLDPATVTYVVSVVEANLHKKDIKTNVYRTLVKKYKQKPGLKSTTLSRNSSNRNYTSFRHILLS